MWQSAFSRAQALKKEWPTDLPDVDFGALRAHALEQCALLSQALGQLEAAQSTDLPMRLASARASLKAREEGTNGSRLRART